MKYLFKLLLFSAFFLEIFQLNAVPALPLPVKLTQPDGTQITVILKGDEHFHYHTTADGYPVIKNEKGVFYYAKLDNSGNLSDTGVKASDIEKRNNAEKVFIKNLPKELISTTNRILANKVKSSVNRIIQKPAKFPKTGSPKSIAILVNFSNLSFVVSNPQEAFTKLLNEAGYSTNGGTGSARDYFKDNSMGTFNPEFDVVGPYTLPQPYSYYGSNDTDGNDKNPVQMVVDACTLAAKNGIDFSQYDTDGDGYVDNVFIYYAGYNEAENASSETVWPHRSGLYPGYNYSGTRESVTFNGKIIEDYACTSELRGNSGSNMCGIGTFCHEFGHVLGLVDFYATNGATHQTLSYWDIMDTGPYLNVGRTPPSYSSHERFYLGWLTPVELKTAKNVTLEPLNTSNKAYLITQNGNSNLNGANPSPTEYFMLENRQRTGWDTYLPGHGLLVTRVNYNATTWNDNTPNNDPNNMGVDIMEADGIANDQTLAGDPFPGTSTINKYTPILNSGTVLTSKPLTFIQETNSIITFRFMGGSEAPSISTTGSFNTFNTVQGTPSAYQEITVSGKKLVADINIAFQIGTHFEMKKSTDSENNWGKSITLTPVDSVVSATKIMVRYNPTIPSYQSTHEDALIISSISAESVKVAVSGKSSRAVYVQPPVANEAKNITYSSFIANWEIVMDGDKPAPGYYLTVYRFINGTDTSYIEKDKWITETSDTIYNLVSDYDYYYYVKASDKNTNLGYENITLPSATIKAHTLAYTSEKVLRVVVNQSTGSVKVFVPSTGSIINVFNAIGQKIKSISSSGDILEITDLPKKQIYIIQSDNYRAKIILW